MIYFYLVTMGDKERLATVFGACGGINLRSLRDRKIFQKQLYFLEQFGLDLGYDFSFYMYGPYSPNATRDAYDLQEQQAVAPDTIEYVEISEEDHRIISRWREFLDEIPSDNRAQILELLSSIHYLSHLSYVRGETREEIERRLCGMKPEFKFTEQELEDAWSLLTRYDLFTS